MNEQTPIRGILFWLVAGPVALIYVGLMLGLAVAAFRWAAGV